jgi:uncharacterized protein (DUF983 family)
MATATKTSKGFAHRCPWCGEQDSLRVDLGDVSQMTCCMCDEGVTADDLKQVVAQYTKLLAWLDAAPAYKSED